eukprot:1158627-Pyramimonas_sp.AAC.1
MQVIKVGVTELLHDPGAFRRDDGFLYNDLHERIYLSEVVFHINVRARTRASYLGPSVELLHRKT